MKKIMFDDHYGLTEAVLEGRKTMTRRIVPECKALYVLRLWKQNEGAIATGYEEKTQSFRFDYCPDKKRRISIDHLNLIPSYKVGEVVAVAQRYSDLSWDQSYYDMLCDMCELLPQYELAGWDNKMFVKAELMPHLIRITDVRVERLQDISDEDCLKEGIIEYAPCCECGSELYAFERADDVWDTPREAFAALIDKISGKGTWSKNPWVYACTFELVK